MKTKPFKPFIWQCPKCMTVVLMLVPRSYKTCKCGATSVDAGDGYYWRCNGDFPVMLKYSKKHGYNTPTKSGFKRLKTVSNE